MTKIFLWVFLEAEEPCCVWAQGAQQGWVCSLPLRRWLPLGWTLLSAALLWELLCYHWCLEVLHTKRPPKPLGHQQK